MLNAVSSPFCPSSLCILTASVVCTSERRELVCPRHGPAILSLTIQIWTGLFTSLPLCLMPIANLLALGDQAPGVRALEHGVRVTDRNNSKAVQTMFSFEP